MQSLSLALAGGRAGKQNSVKTEWYGPQTLYYKKQICEKLEKFLPFFIFQHQDSSTKNYCPTIFSTDNANAVERISLSRYNCTVTFHCEKHFSRALNCDSL